jgi:hypothetical protein
MDEDVAIRLLMLDQKMAFLFQILSLTKTTPDGEQTTRSLGQLFEETQAHAVATRQSVPVAPVDRPDDGGPDATAPGGLP